jgi:SAM-dependent methyltransferase
MPQPNAHDTEILDQFSKQANPFADKPEHARESVLAQIIACAEVLPTHHVLDVACGPGLLTAALARVAASVVGSDVTPAMLERAERDRQRAGLDNLRYERCDARRLTYADQTFDRVLTRFSFHHFEDPAEVLSELVRVCRPGGLVTVIDVAPHPDKLAAYDEVESLRDPSHTHACSLPRLERLFAEAGLAPHKLERFELPMSLERQLAASFPRAGDDERVRALFRADADAGSNRLDMSAHYRDGALHFSYPCAIVVGRRS